MCLISTVMPPTSSLPEISYAARRDPSYGLGLMVALMLSGKREENAIELWILRRHMRMTLPDTTLG